MSNQWQARRGTTIQNDAFTGASGEITYDTDSQGLRVHDGTKQGGYLVDTVVDFQKPTAENNYTWYRLYASGFVEQGGVATGTNGTITLPITMAGSDYQIIANVKNASITGSNAAFSFLTNDLTTTSFGFKKTYDYGSASGVAGEDYFWQVSGMAA